MTYYIAPGLQLTEKAVIDAVCQFYGVTIEEIRSDSRKRFITVPRQVIYYILHVEMGLKTVRVALLIHRDHSTVLATKRLIKGLITYDRKFKGEYSRLIEEIGINVPYEPKQRTA